MTWLANISIDELIKILGWVTSFAVGIIGAILMPVLKRKWQAAALHDAKVTIHPPIPTVHTKEEVELVTKPELEAALTEIRGDIHEIKQALDGERGIARVANGNLHKRIDALSERLGDRLSSLEGATAKVSETVSKLLDIALNPKRPAR